jgi:hypothetical protein
MASAVNARKLQEQCHQNARFQAVLLCRMHESVMKVIGTWFELVDDDGSGGLDSSELAMALKVEGS